MEHSHLSNVVPALLIILIHFSNHMNSCSTNKNSKTSKEYIKTSCKVTNYRRLSYKSLARQASEIKADPKLLAHTALSTTLSAAKYTSRMRIKDMLKIHCLNLKGAAAVLDCIEDIHDSVEELQKSMRELDDAKDSELVLQISDVQTWVNAALEDEATCLDAFASQGPEC